MDALCGVTPAVDLIDDLCGVTPAVDSHNGHAPPVLLMAWAAAAVTLKHCGEVTSWLFCTFSQECGCSLRPNPAVG
jgi:hypothetical protein